MHFPSGSTRFLGDWDNFISYVGIAGQGNADAQFNLGSLLIAVSPHIKVGFKGDQARVAAHLSGASLHLCGPEYLGA